MTKEQIKARILAAVTWGEIQEEIIELVKLAGLEEKYKESDGESFESVIHEACMIVYGKD